MKKPPENAFDALVGILNRSDRTVRDAKDALLKRGVTQEEADRAIEKAKEYGYLSDERFSERYVLYKKETKGKYRLKQELLRKGVEESVAEDALSSYRDSAENCLNLAIRYMKTRVWEPKTAEKLLRHLVGRGFSYEEARAAAESYKRYAKETEDFEIPIGD